MKKKGFSFNDLLKEAEKENIDVFQFNFVRNGVAFAGNNKKPMRVSISIPKDLAWKDLRELREWKMIVIAIRKEKYDFLFDKLTEQLKDKELTKDEE